MYIDDRLITVLRQIVTGERAARTQYRQILDILGNGQPIQNEQVLAEAWAQLGALETFIDRDSRAVILRDAGWRLRSPALASYFASDSPDVASAALGRAQLSPEEWQALIPQLPVRTRGYLRLRDDLPPAAEAVLAQLGVQDRALPLPEAPAVGAATAEDEALPADDAGSETIANAGDTPRQTETPAVNFSASASADEADLISADDTASNGMQDGSIGDLVRRIDAYRKARKRTDASGQTTAQPPAPVDHFAFETDPGGKIVWADEGVASSIIGASLLTLDHPAQDTAGDNAPGDTARPTQPQTQLRTHFRQHLPVRNIPLTLRGAAQIAGEWSLSASPTFARQTGGFLGYVGKFRRARSSLQEAANGNSERSEQLREVLHELRTPINAIQGFSELIQQQLYGPTPNAYRALAAAIAGDSATMLAASEELERFARLEAGDLALDNGACDISGVLQNMIARLRRSIDATISQVNVRIPPGELYVSLTQPDAEMLCWRLLASIVGLSAADDQFSVEIEKIAGRPFVLLTMRLPASFAGAGDACAGVSEPDDPAIRPGALGTDFALRLARAEAKSIGGDMLCEDGQLYLILPTANMQAFAADEAPRTATA